MARQFDVKTDSLDVTSNHRPDTSWRHTDAAGHAHRWHVAKTGQPAESYRPEEAYNVPTLEWVVEAEATDEYPEVGHSECRECRARVSPGFCADTHVQMIAGLTRYRIDGQTVSEDVFRRDLAIEKAAADRRTRP